MEDAMTEQPPTQPIQSPLTLVMKAKSPKNFTALKQTVEHLQSMPPDQNPVTVALDKIGTVHFARFAFLDNNRQLLVITAYDGDFETYLNEFVNEICEVFNKLLSFVVDAPPLPVQTHRQEFFEYVRTHDVRCVTPFYSAYPNHTVLDIQDALGAHR
jgi:hypothetical protein